MQIRCLQSIVYSCFYVAGVAVTVTKTYASYKIVLVTTGGVTVKTEMRRSVQVLVLMLLT